MVSETVLEENQQTTPRPMVTNRQQTPPTCQGFKVKGHATTQDILYHHMPYADILGNCIADLQADKAAQEHELPEHIVSELQRFDHQTRMLHRRITQAHFIALANQNTPQTLISRKEAYSTSQTRRQTCPNTSNC